MRTITIHLKGVRLTPSWEDLQRIVQSSLGHDDGVFIRIARDDGGYDYRSPGAYSIEYAPIDPPDDSIEVKLIVES